MLIFTVQNIICRLNIRREMKPVDWRLLFFQVMYPANLYEVALGGAIKPGTSDLGKATMAEMMLTLILTTVVCLGAVNNQTRSPSAPFCIGLTVTANIIAG